MKPKVLIYFVLMLAVVGCAPKPTEQAFPGTPPVQLPANPAPAPPLLQSEAELSRKAMTVSQKFNNDVSYELRQIDSSKFGDEDVYQWGEWFCALRSMGYKADHIQDRTAKAIEDSGMDKPTLETKLNVTYTMAISTLCPTNQATVTPAE